MNVHDELSDRAVDSAWLSASGIRKMSLPNEDHEAGANWQNDPLDMAAKLGFGKKGMTLV
ncbi:MAG: hypothetical protein ACR2PI_07530 [Hyphomicrobiaceae bacterium]